MCTTLHYLRSYEEHYPLTGAQHLSGHCGGDRTTSDTSKSPKCSELWQSPKDILQVVALLVVVFISAVPLTGKMNS